MNKIRSKSRQRPLRVLIAEDSARMRQNLNDVFAGLPGLKVIGEARDGLETLKVAHALKPDVLTLDIHMPKMNGLEILQRFKKGNCRVIVLTALAEDVYRKKCRELNADHFFDKITEFDEFIEFLKTI